MHTFDISIERNDLEDVMRLESGQRVTWRHRIAKPKTARVALGGLMVGLIFMTCKTSGSFYENFVSVSPDRDERLLEQQIVDMSQVGNPADDDFVAKIYDSVESVYQDQSVVEALRFVTPYHTGLDNIVDVTYLAPVLAAAARIEETEIKVYAFIDTWVGAEQGVQKERFVEQKNENGNCELVNRIKGRGFSDGNGWGVSAELIFVEPPKGAVDLRPRQTLTLASGPLSPRGLYAMGHMWFHEGAVEKIDSSTGTIRLDGPAHLHRNPDDLVEVFRCPHDHGGLRDARQLAEWSARRGTATSAELQGFEDTLMERRLHEVEPISVDESKRKVELKVPRHWTQSHPRAPKIQVGQSIFFSSNEVHAGFMNKDSKFTKVGAVVTVDEETFTAKMDHDCLPYELKPMAKYPVTHVFDGEDPRPLPRFLTMSEAEQTWIKKTIEALGGGQVDVKGKGNFTLNFAALMENGKIEAMKPIGKVTKDAGHEKALPVKIHDFELLPDADVKKDDGVCVVVQEKSIILLERVFANPIEKKGDRAIVHFTVTGHGWETTLHKCGEFCKTNYILWMNGKEVTTIDLWRKDCGDNPLGNKNAGTWTFSRNGWCPGSVNPGVFVDVTDFLVPANNRLEFRIQVVGKENEPYTNLQGQSRDDRAKYPTGLDLSIYPKSAVKAIRAQSKAYSPVEQALREGCSDSTRVSPCPSTGKAEDEADEAKIKKNHEELQKKREEEIKKAKEEQRRKERERAAKRFREHQRHFDDGGFGGGGFGGGGLGGFGGGLGGGLGGGFGGGFRRLTELDRRLERGTDDTVDLGKDGAVAKTNASPKRFVEVVKSESEQRFKTPFEEAITSDVYTGESCKQPVKATYTEAYRNEDGEALKGRVMDTQVAEPWFCADTFHNGTKGGEGQRNIVRVPLLRRENVHLSGRVRLVPVPYALPSDFLWGRVYLHMKLDAPNFPGVNASGKPFGQDFDHWDRFGSIGFSLPKAKMVTSAIPGPPLSEAESDSPSEKPKTPCGGSHGSALPDDSDASIVPDASTASEKSTAPAESAAPDASTAPVAS